MKKGIKRLAACTLAAALLLVPTARGVQEGSSGKDPVIPALVIGGSQITQGRGFLKNVAYLTQEDVDGLRLSGSGEYAYKLGLGDSALTGARTYSTYEDHGTPTWIYRSVYGLDIETAARALGVDTTQRLTVAVSSADGTSKALGDAFGAGTKRWCFDTDGARRGAVGPVLALYETTASSTDVPGPDSTAQFPPPPKTGADSPDAVAPLFGYGQTEADEVNSCFWVKNVNKLRIGSEDVALTLTGADGKKMTTSLSNLLLLGIYEKDYAGGVSATGLPVTALLEGMGAELLPGQSLTAHSAKGETASYSYEQARGLFAAWSAVQDGQSVANATALRLYTVQGEAFADLSELSVTGGGSSASAFPDLEGYGWAKQAVSALAERGVVSGGSDGRFHPGAQITRGDFVLMLSRAFDWKTGEAQENFADVARGSYWYDAIAAGRALGIAQGSGGKFNPGGSITRQDAMVLLARTLEHAGRRLEPGEDLSAYADAASVAPYAADAVGRLVGAGIITGAGGRLSPAAAMTRAELSVALWKAL